MMVVAFIWATRDGQFDDTETPAHRMLFEETGLSAESKETNTSRHAAHRHDKAGGKAPETDRLAG